MLTCPRCGQENPDGALFCNACAAPLAAGEEAQLEERKVVTALFCDLAQDVDVAGVAPHVDAKNPRLAWRDQPLDLVDFRGLDARLKQNSVQEKLTAQWISAVRQA